ncbi:hypothetical protein [Rubrolithibacter danxiaensis]|uniref:hypothetical protein n=1 Tax=Rubrolithibacter danxiaensis TaxID=3390805 RepID=UPI003BF857C9
MDQKVQQAIKASLASFSRVNEFPVVDFETHVLRIFDSSADFVDKLSLLDLLFDESPQLEALREVYFDLLLINFFSEDVKKLEEDYLESAEWEAIEEETIDRGTELLNVLLYLRECADEGLEPDLEDYLKEFLLVDEDEFQDEHRIYEDVIANQILVESSFEEIGRIAGQLDESSEIKDLFYPLMSFFHEQNPGQLMEKYISYSTEPEFEVPVYALLVAYNQSQ